MALTPDQKQKLMTSFGGNTPSSQPASQSNRDRIDSLRAGVKENASFNDRRIEIRDEKADNIVSAIEGTGKFEDSSLVGRGVGATAEAFSGVSETAFQALPEPVRNVLDKIGGGIGKGFNFLTDKIAETDLFSGAVKGDTSKLEEGLRITGDTGRIAAEVLGGAETAAIGNVAQRVVTTGVKNAVAKTQLVAKSGTDRVRNTFKGKDIDTLPEQQAELIKNFRENIIGENKSINNKLDKIALRNGVDSDTLLKEMIEEGGIPVVKGKTADYQPFIESITRENKAVSQAINRRVRQMDTPTDIEVLKAQSLEAARNSRANASRLPQMERKIESIFAGFESKYGKTLRPEDINEIRVDMNKKFKDAEIFVEEAESAISRVARNTLKEIDDSIIEALEHQAKLNRVADTAGTMKRERIGVNEYIEKMGGFTGTILSSTLGIATLAGGPGGLLIAAMASQIGSKIFANALRKKAFSPERFNLIKASLNENPEILQRLIDDADIADKAILNPLRLEAPEAGSPRSSLTGGRTIELPERTQSTIDAEGTANAVQAKNLREGNVSEIDLAPGSLR